MRGTNAKFLQENVDTAFALGSKLFIIIIII
jgi:hypothetical protein